MQSARPHNRRLVLETIRLQGPLSRADLARATGLTNQSVANLVDLLVTEGLVRETGRRPLLRGQPARDLVLRPEGALALGLHLDRRAWSLVVTDLAGQVLSREEGFFDLGAVPGDLLPLWSEAWKRIREGFGSLGPFCGLGIAGPGPQDEKGNLCAPPDFPGWDGVNLKALLQDLTGLDVWLENDARAAAMGELWAGRSQAHRDFLYLYCSWGLGLGLVLEGSLRSGFRGRAGEIADRVAWKSEIPAAENAEFLDRALGVTVQALDVGTVVVGGSWEPLVREALVKELGLRWPNVMVVASCLEDAAAVGAAALALTRRFEGR